MRAFPVLLPIVGKLSLIGSCENSLSLARNLRKQPQKIHSGVRCREVCQTRTNTALDNICSPRTVQPSSRGFDRAGVEEWDTEIYRESSHIQLTSHVFPPSDEKDCSIRDDLGEMLSQT